MTLAGAALSSARSGEGPATLSSPPFFSSWGTAASNLSRPAGICGDAFAKVSEQEWGLLPRPLLTIGRGGRTSAGLRKEEKKGAFGEGTARSSSVVSGRHPVIVSCGRRAQLLGMVIPTLDRWDGWRLLVSRAGDVVVNCFFLNYSI